MGIIAKFEFKISMRYYFRICDLVQSWTFCLSCSFIFQIQSETTNAKPISKSLDNVSICSEISIDDDARSLYAAVSDADDEWSSSSDSLTSDEDSDSISLTSFSGTNDVFQGYAVESCDEDTGESVESSSLTSVTTNTAYECSSDRSSDNEARPGAPLMLNISLYPAVINNILLGRKKTKILLSLKNQMILRPLKGY